MAVGGPVQANREGQLDCDCGIVRAGQAGDGGAPDCCPCCSTAVRKGTVRGSDCEHTQTNTQTSPHAAAGAAAAATAVRSFNDAAFCLDYMPRQCRLTDSGNPRKPWTREHTPTTHPRTHKTQTGSIKSRPSTTTPTCPQQQCSSWCGLWVSRHLDRVKHLHL